MIFSLCLFRAETGTTENPIKKLPSPKTPSPSREEAKGCKSHRKKKPRPMVRGF